MHERVYIILVGERQRMKTIIGAIVWEIMQETVRRESRR